MQKENFIPLKNPTKLLFRDCYQLNFETPSDEL